MEELDKLPFKVGQLAESRSFEDGYRSAWFRCKIQKIILTRKPFALALEFFDFPDEKIKVTKIYQVPPRRRGFPKKIKRQLMLRPQYPPIYLEGQMPRVNAISEVTVIYNGVWKVGDLVDWREKDCYWSGTVTQILSNDNVQIELPPPPVGQGSSYEVFCKDLRPSLDWSPQHGWSVPTSKEGENCCARLITPVNQVPASLPNLETHAVDEGTKNDQATAGSPHDTSFSSQFSANSLSVTCKSNHSMTGEMPGQPLITEASKGATQWPVANTDLDIGDNTIGKTSLSDSVCSSHVRDDAPAETAEHPAGKAQYYCSGSLKKMRTGGEFSFNSLCPDTLEDAILDLEELVNRVKWLKGILEFGVPLSNAGRPQWKFIEHRASSTPK